MAGRVDGEKRKKERKEKRKRIFADKLRETQEKWKTEEMET